MVFNQDQIKELLDIISFTHTLFIVDNVGVDPLTEDDRTLLRKFKIDPDKFDKSKYTPFQAAYLFGKLSQLLGDKNAKKLNYNDLKKYVRNLQYEPLSEDEQYAYRIAQQRTYGHIKDLENRVKQTVNGIVVESSSKIRADYEKLISKEIKRAVKERQVAADIVSSIGNKTQDWGRDLGRIAETELQAVYELGRAEQIAKQSGWDAKVYKDVFAGACRHCIRLFLTAGIGSKPKIFELKELIANGSNVGKKVDDWNPTVPPIHPFCRCLLVQVPNNRVWDDKEKRFKLINKKRDVIYGVKITVGDKVFEI